MNWSSAYVKAWMGDQAKAWLKLKDQGNHILYFRLIDIFVPRDLGKQNMFSHVKQRSQNFNNTVMIKDRHLTLFLETSELSTQQ